jgi:curli biogenesis system outer membrane secretion channel CsgG
MRRLVGLALAALFAYPAVGFSAVPSPPVEVAAPAASVQGAQPPSTPTLVRKVAVGRFTNSTRYGKALLLDGEQDPLAGQASDMLTARLVDSGQFMVFERSDLSVLSREQSAAGVPITGLTGVDALVIGSVTEFGRKTEGNQGFLNSKMRQVATATVEVRLVDVRTGQAFFSTTGTGSATVEVGEVMGFGSVASYDSTLNDKAISAAVSDLINNVVQRLQQRPWFTDVLQVRGDQVFISGGPSQGLRVGSRFRIETQGETITSGQSGLPIKLPGQYVGTIEVLSSFGDGPSSEGSVTRLVAGQLPTGDLTRFVVLEDRQ